MKLFSTLLLLLVFAVSAQAQVSINANDVPAAGTPRYRNILNPTGLSAQLPSGASGWDFSNVSIQRQDTLVWTAASASAFGPFFPMAQLAGPYNSFLAEPLATVYPREVFGNAFLGFNSDSLSHIGNYIEAYTDSTSVPGFTAVVGAQTSFVEPAPALIYNFPMQLGNPTVNRKFTQGIYLERFYLLNGVPTSDSVFVKRTLTRSITPDQVGSLRTPTAFYPEALRVRIDFVEADTLIRKVNGIFQQNIATGGFSQVGYVWLVPGEFEVFVLVEDVNGNPQSAFFYGTTQPVINLRQTALSVLENVGIITVNVDLSFPDNVNTYTVNYTTQDVTAVDGQDYDGISGTLTFNPGQTTKNLQITIIDDTAIEADERFLLTLSNASAGNLGANTQLQVTIIDNDRPFVRFSRRDTGVVESVGTFPFGLLLDQAGPDPINVFISSYDRTAIASTPGNAGDYEPINQVVTFQPGETFKAFNITIVDDNISEVTERFLIRIDSVSAAGVRGFPDSVSINIADNDVNPVYFTLTDTTVFEAVGLLSLPVRLSTPNSNPVTVDFVTVDGSAVAGVDYVGTNGTITFAPFTTRQTVIVEIINDTIPNNPPNRTFRVVLRNPSSNASLSAFADTNVVVTITDNDPIVSRAEGLLAEVVAYPNPSTGAMTLRHTGLVLSQWQVTDLQGRLVMQQSGLQQANETQFDLAQLPQGLYVLSFWTDKGASYMPIMLQR